MFLTGTVAGILSGVILLFFSHVAPLIGARNFIVDLDEPRIFGKAISRREAHLIGALTHLLLSGAFGGVYAILVTRGLFENFHLLPLLGWSLIVSLFVGGVVMPLEGHGLFGVKEDAWFPVDLFVSNALWAVLFWGMMRIWSGGV